MKKEEEEAGRSRKKQKEKQQDVLCMVYLTKQAEEDRNRMKRKQNFFASIRSFLFKSKLLCLLLLACFPSLSFFY